jgi:SAM-dependent methyltransferase
MEPSRFYTGIVAELYSALKSVTQDPEPYAQFIAVSGEPALELGCGAGEPLLELRRRGIDVDGVDSSPDMLERCRRAAAEQGLRVTVHEQRMEALDLPRRYRSIFLAGPTFNLLPDDDAGARALRSIRAHLAPGGAALIPLFIPTPTGDIGEAREAIDADGSVMRFSIIAERRDEGARVQETLNRYERAVDGATVASEDRTWLLHWYSQVGFRALAADAGLSVAAVLDATGRPAADDADVFVFWLTA